MARPDLKDPEALKAYRRELRGVAAPFRIAGLAMVLIAAAMLFYVRWYEMSIIHTLVGQAGLALLALGWILLFWVIARRSAHNRRRMAEPAP